MRAIAVVAMAASGCSLLVTHGQSTRPVKEPDCIDASFPSTLDAVIGTAYGLASITLLLTSYASDDSLLRAENPREARVGAAITGGIAILAFVSSAIGSRRISACREAKQAWRAHLAGFEVGPVSPPVLPPDAPLVEAVTAKDPLAAQLTLQAHRAALRRQCGPTTAADARVRELDPEYHAKVFVVDAAIASCRATSR